jgi:hypothetical protein
MLFLKNAISPDSLNSPSLPVIGLFGGGLVVRLVKSITTGLEFEPM